MGPAYFYHKSLIKDSKSWSSQDILEYQRKTTSPIFERYGTAIRDKSHYRNNINKYNSKCIPGLTITVRTGGTTGTPFSFMMDRFFRRQKERAYIFDIWSDAGYSPFDTRVVFRGSSEKKLITYNSIENAWLISPSHLNKESIKDVKDLLGRLEPFFLHVYPSSLLSLINLIGVDFFSSLPIRGVLAGSESFPIGQLDSFKKDFKIPIAHWYGHSEYAALARYCENCQGFHFYPTYGFTEFAPLEKDLHKIIATSFNKIGTRFVRYDTGDLAKKNQESCSQPFPRVQSIIGRSQEFFIGRDSCQYAFGPFLFGIHSEFWEKIDNIQFIQELPGEIHIQIVSKPGTHCEWLEKFLKTRFKVVEVKISYVGEIKKTEAGKHRYFINKVS